MRLHLLDGLRGFAALGVALYHFLLWEEVVFIASLGTFAVNLFFILSGLTMAYVYRSVFFEAVERADLLRFFRNRIARIIPLLALVAALRLAYEIAIAGDVATESARAFLTATGLFALHLPSFLASTIGAWSLGIEIIFYALFPVLMLASAGARIWHLLVVLAVLLVGQQIVMALLAAEIEPERGRVAAWQMMVTPLAFAPFFAIGFLIERLPDAKHRIYGPVGLMLFLAAMLYSLADPTNFNHSPAVYLLLTALCGGAAFFIYNGVCPVPLTRPMQILGELSYAVYLTHWISYYIVKFGLEQFGLTMGVKLATYLAIVMAVAWASYAGFEAPARRLLRATPARQAP